MPKTLNTFAFIALAFWLLANWGGAYGHLCLDGKEPPLSMHMEMMGGHQNHHDDEPHIDADVKLLQSVLAKISKIDLSLMLALVVLLVLALQPRRLLLPRYVVFLAAHFPHVRPPLRAPPLAAEPSIHC